MNYGMNVRIKFKKDSPFANSEETRHNVTEIHYNYPSLTSIPPSVAFESDIHGTGGTIRIDHIDEFEAKIAIRKEKEY